MNRHVVLALARCLIVVLCLSPGWSRSAGQGPFDGDQAGDQRIGIAIQALNRLKGMDLEANPKIKQAVYKVLDSIKGTPEFVEFVQEFRVRDQNPALLEMALNNPTNSLGSAACRALLANEGVELLRAAMEQSTGRLPAVQVLGPIGQKQAVSLLAGFLLEGKHSLAERKQAIESLVQTREGSDLLLNHLKENKLPAELGDAAASGLARVPWDAIRTEIERIRPRPSETGEGNLPSVAELIKMEGDAGRGAAVYARPEIACISCHQVRGQGVDFGPNLTEIGSKLGKDALYQAILEPSAGISFGYEAWQIELKDGEEAYGLLVSETNDEIAVKLQGGIVHRFKKSGVVSRQKSASSVMPAGLHQALSVQELVDLVEFLSSLKQKPAQD